MQTTLPVRRGHMLVAGIAALAMCAGANASLTDPAITINVSSSVGSGSYTITTGEGFWFGDTYIYSLFGAPIEIRNESNQLIASVTQLSTTVGSNPTNPGDPLKQLALGFSVTAGNADTIVTIESGLSGFDSIDFADGRASAGLTLTDSDGNGASITGLNANGGAYGAAVNGLVRGGGSDFTDLFLGTRGGAAGFDSTAWTDATPIPDSEFVFVGSGAVSSQSTRWLFELSANDQASGTSSFWVRPSEIPAPGSAALLALGGLVATRRRR